MNKSDYLFYSLVHGSISCWFRLKWLCDIPSISNNGKDYDSPKALRKVNNSGIDRMVGQGLRLANSLFLMPIPLSIKEASKKESHVKNLDSYALHSILNDKSEFLLDITGPRNRFKAALNKFIHYDLQLRVDLKYKIGQFRVTLFCPLDWETLNLPPQLFYLYYPLRPFFWLKRHL